MYLPRSDRDATAQAAAMSPAEIRALSARLDRDLPDVVRHGSFPAWDDVRCLFAEIDRLRAALESLDGTLALARVDAPAWLDVAEKEVADALAGGR